MAASVCMSAAQAANFGHSRIVSGLGQPLHLEIQVTELTQQEIDTLRATPAPADAWHAAGMTPPVPLQTMRLMLLDGYRPDVKVIQLRSERAFDDAIVDVLLDVRSASGQQRYQVSLVAHADTHTIQRASVESGRNRRAIDGLGLPAEAGDHSALGRQISVRSGDNMFAVARRNAVQGVTVYQMMIALQRSNSHAFIEDNVNLVKAGATLTMPDMAALTALSDREARRIFLQHAQAFALYRQRGLRADVAVASTVLDAAGGEVVEPAPLLGQPESAEPASRSGDRLRLSGAPSAGTNPGPSETSRGTALSGSAAGEPGGRNGATGNGTAVNGSAGAAHNDAISRLGGISGLNGVAAAAANKPPVSLLASSGAIASDAVVHEAPDALSGDFTGSPPFGSDASSAGTIVTAGAMEIDPDDEAARKKRVEESKKRILELEDNVRHLNEALQKQGHVAAEAALEGARSVTEVIKEVMSLVDPEEGVDGTATAAAGAEAKAGVSVPGDGSAAGTPASDGSASEGAASPGTASGGPAGGSPAADGSAADSRRAGAGNTEGDQAPSEAAAAAGSAAGSAARKAPERSAATPSARSATESVAGASANGKAAAASADVENKESWLKENMWAVIGGGLALLVLIVVWALRRASSAREDEFESDSPISDSILQQKLREIDLDLDNPPSGGRRSS